MPKSKKSSNRWLQRQARDPYVKRAQAEGYRSRAAYKLLEIQQRDQMLKPGMTVVDLGAAPGGWSLVSKHLVGEKGKVIALDILPMDPIAGVEFIQGDFAEDEIYQKLSDKIERIKLGVVLCDIAPNISGMKSIDQPRSMYLVELATDFAIKSLIVGGDYLVKVFQGEGFDEHLALLRSHFTKVNIRKPAASRKASKEVYLLARGFNPI